ncbi:MAG: alanine racemase [Pseudomonadota bacterium]
MNDDYRPRLTVDLAALRRNARTMAAMRPGAEMMPVVKADAYGLGAETIVRSLLREGITSFFVAFAEEAAPLAAIAPEATCYVFGAAPGTGPYTDRIRPVLYRRDDLEAWSSGPCAVQIELGMNRLGMRAEALHDLAPRDEVALVVAHMSDAGTPSSPRIAQQREQFAQAVLPLKQVFPRARFSLSSTGHLMLGATLKEAAIRPGIGLFGAAPGPQGALEPVATYEARVMSVHDVPAGETVGYGGRWTAARSARIATIGAGYADGIPRELTNKGKVWVGGSACLMVGTVSMDLTTIDVTDAGAVDVGDWAEIFGPHIAISDVAAQLSTIDYDLLTGIRGRTIRRYVNDSDK